jgi:hypothetical protein
MFELNRLNHLITMIMLSLFIVSCSQLGIQLKKETPESASIPECKKNYAGEGIWLINRVYKTWVTYDPLDYKKGFDAVLATLKSGGSQTISADRDSGTISTEMTFGNEKKKTYPVEIKLVKEKSSLKVNLSSKSASGDSGKEGFCSFYNEFEKSVKRLQPAPSAKHASPPPKKPVEKPVEAKKSEPPPSPPPASPPVRETPIVSSPPSALSKDLPQTEVVWTLVNLREGPGMNYKVLGKVKRGAPLAVLGEQRGWLHVLTEDGKEVWIFKKATSEKREAAPTPVSPPPSVSSSASSPPAPPSPSPSPSTPGDSAKPKSPM